MPEQRASTPGRLAAPRQSSEVRRSSTSPPGRPISALKKELHKRPPNWPCDRKTTNKEEERCRSLEGAAGSETPRLVDRRALIRPAIAPPDVANLSNAAWTPNHHRHRMSERANAKRLHPGTALRLM